MTVVEKATSDRGADGKASTKPLAMPVTKRTQDDAGDGYGVRTEQPRHSPRTPRSAFDIRTSSNFGWLNPYFFGRQPARSKFPRTLRVDPNGHQIYAHGIHTCSSTAPAFSGRRRGTPGPEGIKAPASGSGFHDRRTSTLFPSIRAS